MINVARSNHRIIRICTIRIVHDKKWGLVLLVLCQRDCEESVFTRDNALPEM